MAIFRSAFACFVLAVIVGLGVRMTTAPASGAFNTPAPLETPSFVQAGKRYAFTWSGGGPSQTYMVKTIRQDGWVLVEVAEETINPAYLAPGEFPTRWLNVALAISIQEMRPLLQ